jgi:hypothetical protein
MTAQLQPWIEQEKIKHIKRAVMMANRGFQRIEKLWDENESPPSEVRNPCCRDLGQT